MVENVPFVNMNGRCYKAEPRMQQNAKTCQSASWWPTFIVAIPFLKICHYVFLGKLHNEVSANMLLIIKDVAWWLQIPVCMTDNLSQRAPTVMCSITLLKEQMLLCFYNRNTWDWARCPSTVKVLFYGF